MSWSASIHWETLFILPVLAVNASQCGDAKCQAVHYQVVLGWLWFSLDVVI